ncbi:MAG: acetyl-CoA carboxylase biotin carboxyl carrier protein subunit [Sphingomicrobium sp.]
MAETAKSEAKSEKDRAMRIDPALVRELAELLNETGLTEIEVDDGDRKIKVSRGALVHAAPAAPVATAAAAPAPAAAPAEEVSGETVKSPMVGTAFLSAEPGGAPFIAVGDTVKAGDTLLIVEAMKVMNPIIAPSAGVVRKIMIADAHPVEFDQPLMIIG